MWRESIELDGAGHGAPIPSACRVGPLVMTSGIQGKSRETGEMGTGIAEQTRLAFENLAAAFEAAGGSVDDIAHVTVFMVSRGEREVLNKYWEEWFPDPESRPARHAIEMPLPGGMLIQLEATGYVDGREES
jgi:2-iminobutanoate/2-iminopropanoate deaminase